MPTAGDTREIADYLRFSALGCYYRWRAQISQFGQAQAGPGIYRAALLTR